MAAPDETAEIIRELREKLDKVDEMEALTDAAYREIVKANSRNSARVVLLERERDTLITRAEAAEKRLAEAVAAEREACAKIAEQVARGIWEPEETAKRIRARGSAEAQNGRPNND